MPGKETHFGAGALASTLTYIAECERRNLGYDLGEVLGAALGGGVAGITPDALEPADNPNHREFFHSVLFGAGVLGSVNEIEKQNITEKQKIVLKSMSAGYLSHLAADATTTKRLPLIK